MKRPSTVIDSDLPNKTEIPQIINSINRYLPTLRIFGVCSSNCPITILPIANMMLTIAISNHSDSVDHITFLFFGILCSYCLMSFLWCYNIISSFNNESMFSFFSASIMLGFQFTKKVSNLKNILSMTMM